MRRGLFRILASLSLLALLAVFALHLRARARTDLIAFGRGGRACTFLQLGRSQLRAPVGGYVHLIVGRNWPVDQPLTWQSAPDGWSLGPWLPFILGKQGTCLGIEWTDGAVKVAVDKDGRTPVWHPIKDELPAMSPPVPAWELTVPYMHLAAAFAATPALSLALTLRRRLRDRRRARRGLCLQCGYDLRAHHPGQHCPECGTPILRSEAIP